MGFRISWPGGLLLAAAHLLALVDLHDSRTIPGMVPVLSVSVRPGPMKARRHAAGPGTLLGPDRVCVCVMGSTLVVPEAGRLLVFFVSYSSSLYIINNNIGITARPE